jgi:predicted DNA-binding transcriptional regulator YafY
MVWDHTDKLRMLILGWGPDVEVMQPVPLRKKIMKLHKKCADKCEVRSAIKF